MKYVPYYRVNNNATTSKPLMDRQRKLVRKFVKDEPLAEFIEMETRSRKRPELAKAIKLCQSNDAALIIPRSDGLNLKDALKRIKIICLDYSESFVDSADNVIAFHRDARSNRAYQGMLGAKADGKKLGAQHPAVAKGRDRVKAWAKASKVASEVNRARREEHYSNLQSMVKKLRKDKMTLQGIAEKLNGSGFLTSRGMPFTAVAVRRVLIYEEAN